MYIINVTCVYFIIGCSICLNEVATDPIIMNCCSKVFCKLCINKALEHSSLCPNCRVAVKQVEGNQPTGTMGHYVSQSSLPGYEGSGTIVIKYTIPSGMQTNEHPNPGINSISITSIILYMYL